MVEGTPQNLAPIPSMLSKIPFLQLNSLFLILACGPSSKMQRTQADPDDIALLVGMKFPCDCIDLYLKS